jgi:hypothetical protein
MEILEKLKETVTGTLSKLKGTSEIEEVSYGQLAEKIPELTEIVYSVVGSLADGFQWSDAVTLGKVVGPFMTLASTINDFTGEQKKQFVVDAVWLTYKTVDGYPDGTKNNINVPLLIGGLETKFERKIVTFAAEWAVNSLFDVLRDKGDV